VLRPMHELLIMRLIKQRLSACFADVKLLPFYAIAGLAITEVLQAIWGDF
jgi:hypothetical protein